MTPVVEIISESGELPPENIDVQRSPSPVEYRGLPSPRPGIGDELELSQRDIDSASINSVESIPDFSGRKILTFDDERTVAYEAWEFVCIEDRHTRQSWKSFCGINFGDRWRNLNDGYVWVNAIVSLDQGELADMYEDAVRGFKHKPGISQEKAYEQDLANRVNDLQVDAYDRVQHLIGDKIVATNRNPYRQREWRVAVLQPGEFQMTELLPERKKRGFFSRKRQDPITRKYFVILRGKEVKSTKEDGGWRAYNRISNPWWRLDNQETKEERDQHREVTRKMDRARDRRYLDSRPRSRPVDRIPSRPPPGRGPSPTPGPGDRL
ncbi:hypothetical protein F4803DRAFT_292703 [Xylaria telfairii]|nr:hypothetical protein F4803DRAFT_292703 [Xylaria telfairii]